MHCCMQTLIMHIIFIIRTCIAQILDQEQNMVVLMEDHQSNVSYHYSDNAVDHTSHHYIVTRMMAVKIAGCLFH